MALGATPLRMVDLTSTFGCPSDASRAFKRIKIKMLLLPGAIRIAAVE